MRLKVSRSTQITEFRKLKFCHKVYFTTPKEPCKLHLTLFLGTKVELN
jgi:hypothetical protein